MPLVRKLLYYTISRVADPGGVEPKHCEKKRDLDPTTLDFSVYINDIIIYTIITITILSINIERKTRL